MFLPIVAKILPIVNAITIAITRMIQAFAALLGIDLGDLQGATSGYTVDDSVADYYDDVADSVDGVTDSTDKATAAAKKWQNQTLAFDEITKLNANDSSSSGSSGSGGSGGSGSGGYGALDDAIAGMTNDYLGIFNEKMNAINETAEKMADSICKFFKDLKNAADPTLKSIQKLYNNGFKLLMNFTWGTIKDFYNNFLVPVGTWALGEGLPKFFDVTNDILTKINGRS